MVDQMLLRKGKTPPERQPPVAKDKGKEKQIEIEEDAIPQQKKNPPMLFKNFNKLPALLSIFDALCMSKELRSLYMPCNILSYTKQAYLAEIHMKEVLYALHTASITFSEIDQLLGTTEHNRPLYVTGTSDGAKVNRILLD